jgi:regulator of sirC expression with transglutaminase-like and TPR domain
MSHELDALEGALRIARVEYPGLDADACRARLDEFAALAGGTLRGLRGVERLNTVFFGTLGFRGNDAHYHDPRNSYVNDVLERRLGIPLSLALVWMEVARRCGLRVEGVGFPGHFLARALLPRREVLVDCFTGRILGRKDCAALLRGPDAPAFGDALFAAAPPRAMLIRMLNNLRGIHVSRGEFDRVLRWIDLQLELDPDDPALFRERGLARFQLGRFGRAVDDLDRYLRLAPDAPDAGPVRARREAARKLLSQLN